MEPFRDFLVDLLQLVPLFRCNVSTSLLQPVDDISIVICQSDLCNLDSFPVLVDGRLPIQFGILPGLFFLFLGLVSGLVATLDHAWISHAIRSFHDFFIVITHRW